jgi:hypothetical protein
MQAINIAGAIGQRTWMLLPFEADWRWMIERDDSPWYPTMRLFRQQEEGRWGYSDRSGCDRGARSFTGLTGLFRITGKSLINIPASLR